MEQTGVVVKAGEEINPDTGKTSFKMGVDKNIYTLFKEGHIAFAKENLGKRVKATYSMSADNRFRNVEAIEPVTYDPSPFRGEEYGDREHLIVRQSVLKAAAVVAAARGSIETEEVIEIARRMEAYVYEKVNLTNITAPTHPMASFLSPSGETPPTDETEEEPPDLWGDSEETDFPTEEVGKSHPPTSTNLATAAQIARIKRELKTRGKDQYDDKFVAYLKASFDVEELNELTKDQASKVIGEFVEK